MDSAAQPAGFPEPLDLTQVRVFPLEERRSLSKLADVLIRPDSEPCPTSSEIAEAITECAERVRRARARGAGVVLMYGAHLVKNGLMAVVNRLIQKGWITHLATNGAGTIHDWEFAHLGRTEESVRENVVQGRFGTWDETGRAIHLAVLIGALRGEGYGRSLGRFIDEDGTVLATRAELERELLAAPGDRLAPARAELLSAMQLHEIEEGRHAFQPPSERVQHPVAGLSFGRTAYGASGDRLRHFSTHPWFNGGAIGRAAGTDFALFARAVESLDGGVVLSVGFGDHGAAGVREKPERGEQPSLAIRKAQGQRHSIYVVDIQDGGGWNWADGEPPKDNPAYYLRFCKLTRAWVVKCVTCRRTTAISCITF
jgi:hypothetical protein